MTEVTPAGPFWEAEPEHQDYLERYPTATPAISFGPTGSFQAERRRAARQRFSVIQAGA